MYTIIAMAVMIYALTVYQMRARSIRLRTGAAYDDRLGPVSYTFLHRGLGKMSSSCLPSRPWRSRSYGCPDARITPRSPVDQSRHDVTVADDTCCRLCFVFVCLVSCLTFATKQHPS
jgi:hypothetical protein